MASGRAAGAQCTMASATIGKRLWMSCKFDESPVSAAGCTAVRDPESAIEFESVIWISVKQRTWTAPPSTAAVKMELKAGSSHTGVVRADREAAGVRLLKQARDMSDLYYSSTVSSLTSCRLPPMSLGLGGGERLLQTSSFSLLPLPPHTNT